MLLGLVLCPLNDIKHSRYIGYHSATCHYGEINCTIVKFFCNPLTPYFVCDIVISSLDTIMVRDTGFTTEVVLTVCGYAII